MVDIFRERQQFENAMRCRGEPWVNQVNQGFNEATKRWNHKSLNLRWAGWLMHVHYSYLCKKQSLLAKERAEAFRQLTPLEMGRKLFLEGIAENKVYNHLDDEYLNDFQTVMDGYYKTQKEVVYEADFGTTS